MIANGDASCPGGAAFRFIRAFVVAAAVLPLPVAHAAVFFDKPVELARGDAVSDWNLRIATDRAGTWLAAWGRDSFFVPAEIVSVRSTDAGASWSAPVAAGLANSFGPLGLVATGAGRFVVAWADFFGPTGTFVALTTDGGATWSAPRTVPIPANAPVRQLHGDPGGTLLVSYVTFPGFCRFHVIRSADEGLSWGAPTVLGAPASAPNNSSCPLPHLASDGSGGWMAVWQSEDSLGGTIGTDLDIVFSHSSDDGISWSAAAAVDPGAAADGAEGDTAPAVGSDRVGRWIVAWQSSNTLGGTLSSEGAGHVLVSRSDDDGGTWTSPTAMSPRAATEDDFYEIYTLPRHLVAGSNGVWLYSALRLTEGTNLVSRSVDGGLTWTVPNRLNGWMRPANHQFQYLGGLQADGAGNWVAGWSTLDQEDPDWWISLSAGSVLCPAPLSGCKTTTPLGRSTLLLSERKPLRPVLKWKWKGQATSLDDFGDPSSSGSYRACLYDAAGHALFGGRIAPGGTCGTAPCWRASGTGFTYKTSPANSRYGLVKLMLKAGDDGAAKVILGGRGEPLANPPLGGFDLPLRMQVDSSETGTCWEATFNTPTTDLPTWFQAQSD